ncbi:hypothetical protein [Roseivirga sp.]
MSAGFNGNFICGDLRKVWTIRYLIKELIKGWAEIADVLDTA